AHTRPPPESYRLPTRTRVVSPQHWVLPSCQPSRSGFVPTSEGPACFLVTTVRGQTGAEKGKGPLSVKIVGLLGFHCESSAHSEPKSPASPRGPQALRHDVDRRAQLDVEHEERDVLVPEP